MKILLKSRAIVYPTIAVVIALVLSSAACVSSPKPDPTKAEKEKIIGLLKNLSYDAPTDTFNISGPIVIKSVEICPQCDVSSAPPFLLLSEPVSGVKPAKANSSEEWGGYTFALEFNNTAVRFLRASAPYQPSPYWYVIYILPPEDAPCRHYLCDKNRLCYGNKFEYEVKCKGRPNNEVAQEIACNGIPEGAKCSYITGDIGFIGTCGQGRCRPSVGRGG